VNVAGLSEIKNELKELDKGQLLELCLSLAKYKKDNKEYLGFLLFQSHDKQVFVSQLKELIDTDVQELKTQPNLYYIKKGLRRILRIINKYCKYVADKAIEADIHIHFCAAIKQSGIPYHREKRIVNLYEAELKKINTLVKGLHEDVRQDYASAIEQIAEERPQGLISRIKKKLQ
jgi:hypothetical protein